MGSLLCGLGRGVKWMDIVGSSGVEGGRSPAHQADLGQRPGGHLSGVAAPGDELAPPSTRVFLELFRSGRLPREPACSTDLRPFMDLSVQICVRLVPPTVRDDP